MDKFLQDTVAIVTGGALGIGGEIARRLAANGARVLIADVAEEEAEANTDRIVKAGGAAVWMSGDVSDSMTARKMVDRSLSEWGRLDILVQNAYGGSEQRRGSAVDVSESAFDSGMGLLVRALYLGAKYAVPAMVESGPFPSWTPGAWAGMGLRQGERPAENVGRIVNISSVHGIMQAPDAIVYETGKAAVIGMTRQMALDFGQSGITVNAIAPGHIVTERIEEIWRKHGNEAGFHLFELQYPVRRTGIPADIANAVAFLCSPESGFVTGVTLPVDGGLSIQLQENIVMDVKDYIQEHPELRTYFDESGNSRR